MATKINVTNWFLIVLSIVSIGSALYFYNENQKLKNKITGFLGAAKAMETENQQLRSFASDQKDKIDFLENINVADSINKKLRTENNLPLSPEEENNNQTEPPSFKDLNKRQP